MHFKCERPPRVTNCVCLVKNAVYDAGTTGLVNSEAEMLAFVSGACSVTGAQGRTECAKADKPPYSSRCCFPTHKKSTTHNVARFLMWWGQQGSNL